MKLDELISSWTCDKFLLEQVDWVRNNLPEVFALKRRAGEGHKDNYVHTAGVIGNVLEAAGAEDLSERQRALHVLVALLHDIGKGPTGKFENGKYTFWKHEQVSAKMAKEIISRCGVSLTKEEQDMVLTVIKLHGRPKAIVEEGVTDSAVRRLMTDAGQHFYDLLWFCKCDATTKYQAKRDKYKEQMDSLLTRGARLAAEEEEKAWRPPFNGHDIMQILGLDSSDRNSGGVVGDIKERMIAMVKNGELTTREDCLDYLYGLKAESVVNDSDDEAHTFTIEDVLAAAQMGFVYRAEAQNDGESIPAGNVLQWAMHRKNLTLVPKSWQKYKGGASGSNS